MDVDPNPTDALVPMIKNSILIFNSILETIKGWIKRYNGSPLPFYKEQITKENGKVCKPFFKARFVLVGLLASRMKINTI